MNETKPDEMVIDTTNAQAISSPDAHASPPSMPTGWVDHEFPWRAPTAASRLCPGCRERDGVVPVKVQIEFPATVATAPGAAAHSNHVSVSQDARYCERCLTALLRAMGVVEKEAQPAVVQTGHDTYEEVQP